LRTKSVVKWGLIGAMVLTATALWMVATDIHVSKHEYKWQKTGERTSQNIPFAKEK
jgi:hypothetical protein